MHVSERLLWGPEDAKYPVRDKDTRQESEDVLQENKKQKTKSKNKNKTQKLMRQRANKGKIDPDL